MFDRGFIYRIKISYYQYEETTKLNNKAKALKRHF